MTTVSQRDGLTLGQALAMGCRATSSWCPRSGVSAGQVAEDVDKDNDAEFKGFRGQRRLRRAGLSQVPRR